MFDSALFFADHVTMHRLSLFAAVFLLAACTAATPTDVAPSSDNQAPATAEGMELSAPLPDSIVTSPLEVTGKATGGWYFEGSFPILLTDDAGNVIRNEHVTAQGEWMTPELVEFAGEIAFQTIAEKGYLILRKDNPSGIPENDMELKVPVRFQ